MFKNAVEKFNKFYEINFSQNSHADELFDVLNEIIKFNFAAIFYLTPNKLTLEFGKNFEIYEDIKLDDNISTRIYDTNSLEPVEEIKNLLHINSNILVKRLIVKGAVFGILIIERDYEFSEDEQIIFTTCASIIANLIKDLELSKVLKMQVQSLQDGIEETNKAYETIKKQNKKIKENEKLQNTFIANISHDLRTPLNSIIGFSELLSKKIFGELNEKQNEYIEDIRISGLKLMSMINEILDISKIESHRIRLNLSVVDINVLIEEVCNILKPLFDKKNIQIKKSIIGEIEFEGDYIKLQQVLFNIIGNAIKYSPENSEIKIFAYQDTNNITIKIQDEGIGIESKYHKKIFNKFFQVQDTMSKTEASTGLGLTITKEFIKMHGGKIKVESEPNKGATFIITLPLLDKYKTD